MAAYGRELRLWDRIIMCLVALSLEERVQQLTPGSLRLFMFAVCLGVPSFSSPGISTDGFSILLRLGIEWRSHLRHVRHTYQVAFEYRHPVSTHHITTSFHF